MADRARFVGLNKAERPSAKVYSDALTAKGHRLREDMMRALCLHAGASNATLTPFEVSKRMGWSTGPNKPQFRRSYGTLGRWIAEETGIEGPVSRFKDHGRVVRIYAIAGSSTDGTLRWKLYPEFVTALDRLPQSGDRPPDRTGSEPTAEELTANEGGIQHVNLERKIRRRWLAQQRKSLDGFRCRVCDLKMEIRYGALGKHYAEAHHVIWPSPRGERDVLLSELVTLCPNCHRIIHVLLRGRHAATIEQGLERVNELRTIVEYNRAQTGKRS